MIIKEKRWLSKFVAMLCVLTMVVGVLTPASVGVAAASQVKKMYIKVVGDLGYISPYEDDMKTTDEEIDNYYQFKGNTSDKDGYIEILPISGETFNMGDVITFYITNASNAPSVVAEYTNVTVNSNGNNRWKVEITIGRNTKDNLEITPTVQYSVTYSESTDYKITNIEGNKVLSGLTEMYNSNSPVEFKVTATESDKKDVVVSINGKKEEPSNDGVYKISSLTSNTRVVASVKDKQYLINVIGDNTGGYVCSAVNNTNVAYGTDYSFYVAPKAGYGTPTVYVYKTEGGQKNDSAKIIPVGNNYTISRITENKTIEIVSGDVEMCDVIFTEGTGYSVTCNSAKDGVAHVSYGKKLEFSVTLDTGYKMQRVTVNGRVLDGREETDKKYNYTIKEITGNSTIEVTVKKEKYTVDFSNEASDECELIKGSEKTEYEHGDTCTFYVIPKDGCKAPTVKVNDSLLKPVNGTTQYETTIIGKTTIKITSNGKITYDITYNTEEGYSFSTKPNKVEYGGTLEFILKVEKDYNNSKPVVLVGGKKQDPENPSPTADPDEGFKEYKYTVENITSAQIVSVSGIQKNTYKVTLPASDPKYTVTTHETTTLTAGSTFTFHVSINPGYKKGTDFKIIAGTEVFNEPGDCTIKNVESNIVIEIIGIDENTFAAIRNNNHVISIEGDADCNLDKLKYGEALKFTVTPEDYYHVTLVAVDGEVITPVSGVYTVKNIKSVPTITVETEANKLTVNYVDEKYPDNNETIVYTTESDVKNAKKIVDNLNSVYEFSVWKYNGEGGPKEIKNGADINGEEVNLLSLVKTVASKEITLTASWILNGDVLQKMITLKTDKLKDTPNGGVTTFKTMISVVKEVVDDLPTDEKDEIEVTALGTLFSKESLVAANVDKSKIEESMSKEGIPSNGYKRVAIDEMYNYYYQCNYQLDELSNTYFRLLLKGVSDDKYNGLGWIQLNVDGNTMILVANL